MFALHEIFGIIKKLFRETADKIICTTWRVLVAGTLIHKKFNFDETDRCTISELNDSCWITILAAKRGRYIEAPRASWTNEYLLPITKNHRNWQKKKHKKTEVNKNDQEGNDKI